MNSAWRAARGQSGHRCRNSTGLTALESTASWDRSSVLSAIVPEMSDRALEDSLLTLAFSIESNPGAYALLIGAGVSAGSGVKTAWGVLEDLVGRVAMLEGAEDLSDPLGWYQREFHDEPRYEALLERLAPTPHERQRLLRGYFEASAEEVESGEKAPTPAHHAIARLIRGGFVRVVVTLNFDRLIEQAVRTVGVEPTVVASHSDVEGMAPLHTLDCCVIHLHGDYLNAPTMRNTTSELAAYQPATLALLHRVLEDYGLIIAGWSAQYDPVLRDAISSHYPARFTLTWIEPSQPSNAASDLRALKNGLLVPCTADSAFGRLADAVDALRARNAPHPLTVPVAVATAKRQLSGRTVAVDLHDTLNQELQRLHDHPDFHLPSYQSDSPYGGYATMLGRVEGSSRLTCALVATLAYWGTQETDRWWVDELRRFAVRPRTGGMTALLGLRLVTGSALFYAAGVAAVASQRFELLAQLLAIRVSDPHSTDQPLAAQEFEPAAVYGVSDGTRRGYALVEPVLREGLSLNNETLDEAWQRFEVLRLAVAAMHTPRFPELVGEFLAADNELALAERVFDAAERDGTGSDEVGAARRQVWDERGRRLGYLASTVRLASPHLLSATDSSAAHRVPAADRIAEAVAAEGAAHPLVAAGVADNPDRLSAALAAVSMAGGRLGERLAWERVPPGGGIVVDEIWLDSGETPDERRLREGV